MKVSLSRPSICSKEYDFVALHESSSTDNSRQSVPRSAFESAREAAHHDAERRAVRTSFDVPVPLPAVVRAVVSPRSGEDYERAMPDAFRGKAANKAVSALFRRFAQIEPVTRTGVDSGAKYHAVDSDTQGQWRQVRPSRRSAARMAAPAQAKEALGPSDQDDAAAAARRWNRAIIDAVTDMIGTHDRPEHEAAGGARQPVTGNALLRPYASPRLRASARTLLAIARSECDPTAPLPDRLEARGHLFYVLSASLMAVSRELAVAPSPTAERSGCADPADVCRAMGDAADTLAMACAVAATAAVLDDDQAELAWRNRTSTDAAHGEDRAAFSWRHRALTEAVSSYVRGARPGAATGDGPSRTVRSAAALFCARSQKPGDPTRTNHVQQDMLRQYSHIAAAAFSHSFDLVSSVPCATAFYLAAHARLATSVRVESALDVMLTDALDAIAGELRIDSSDCQVGLLVLSGSRACALAHAGSSLRVAKAYVRIACGAMTMVLDRFVTSAPSYARPAASVSSADATIVPGFDSRLHSAQRQRLSPGELADQTTARGDEVVDGLLEQALRVWLDAVYTCVDTLRGSDATPDPCSTLDGWLLRNVKRLAYVDLGAVATTLNRQPWLYDGMWQALTAVLRLAENHLRTNWIHAVIRMGGSHLAALMEQRPSTHVWLKPKAQVALVDATRLTVVNRPSRSESLAALEACIQSTLAFVQHHGPMMPLTRAVGRLVAIISDPSYPVEWRRAAQSMRDRFAVASQRYAK